MSLPAHLDPADIPRLRPDLRAWFRYPLHRRDFHALDRDARLLGHYAAKPLYARLDAHGRVDRASGFDGRIAGLFLPATTEDWPALELLFAETDPALLQAVTPMRRRDLAAKAIAARLLATR